MVCTSTTVFARWLLQGEGAREVQRESQLRLISRVNCWWQTLSWHHVHSGGGPCFENSCCWKPRHAKSSPRFLKASKNNLSPFWLCNLYQPLITPQINFATFHRPKPPPSGFARDIWASAVVWRASRQGCMALLSSKPRRVECQQRLPWKRKIKNARKRGKLKLGTSEIETYFLGHLSTSIPSHQTTMTTSLLAKMRTWQGKGCQNARTYLSEAPCSLISILSLWLRKNTSESSRKQRLKRLQEWTFSTSMLLRQGYFAQFSQNFHPNIPPLVPLTRLRWGAKAKALTLRIMMSTLASTVQVSLQNFGAGLIPWCIVLWYGCGTKVRQLQCAQLQRCPALRLQRGLRPSVVDTDLSSLVIFQDGYVLFCSLMLLVHILYIYIHIYTYSILNTRWKSRILQDMGVKLRWNVWIMPRMSCQDVLLGMDTFWFDLKVDGR